MAKNLLQGPLYGRLPRGLSVAEITAKRTAWLCSLGAPRGGAVRDAGATSWRRPTPEEAAKLKLHFGDSGPEAEPVADREHASLDKTPDS